MRASSRPRGPPAGRAPCGAGRGAGIEWIPPTMTTKTRDRPTGSGAGSPASGNGGVSQADAELETQGEARRKAVALKHTSYK